MPPVPTRGGRQHHQRTEVHRLFTCSQQLERTGPSGEFVLANGRHPPVATWNQGRKWRLAPSRNAAWLAPHPVRQRRTSRPPRQRTVPEPPTNRTGRGDTRTQDTGRRALGNLAGGRQGNGSQPHPVSGRRDVGRTMTFEARVGERDAARIFRGRSSIPRPRSRTSPHRPTPVGQEGLERRRVPGDRGGPSRN